MKISKDGLYISIDDLRICYENYCFKERKTMYVYCGNFGVGLDRIDNVTFRHAIKLGIHEIKLIKKSIMENDSW
jgi:hypothetical protein